MKRARLGPWAQWARGAGLLGLCGLAGLNALAYRHAQAFTRFSTGGSRTPRPESLTLGQKLGVLVVGPHVPRPSNTGTPGALGLPYERHVFPGHRRLPLEAWYIPRGPSRGIVVLFHGHAGAKDALLRHAAALHEMGWAPLLVDFHGSGGSGGSETTLGFHEAEDVVAALRYARALPGRHAVVLYGESMGAAAVLRAAGALGARPDALILEAPFDRLERTVERRFASFGVPSFPAAQLLLFWGGVQSGFDGFRHNPEEYARGVATPALLLVGASDPWATPEDVGRIRDALRGPKRLETFSGVRHESLLHRRPAQWRAAVTAFLGTVPAAGAAAP